MDIPVRMLIYLSMVSILTYTWIGEVTGAESPKGLTWNTQMEPVFTGCINSAMGKFTDQDGPMNAYWCDSENCDNIIIQRCNRISKGNKTMDVQPGECIEILFSERAQTSGSCPTGHFVKSVNCVQTACYDIQLNCCKPSNEFTVATFEQTESRPLRSNGQLCPQTKVAVGFKWLEESDRRRLFSLVCASIEANAIAGTASGYWTMVCSTNGEDKSCPFGGESESVVRERIEYWDTEFTKSINDSLRKPFWFQNYEIKLEGPLVDSVMRLVARGRDFAHISYNGLKTTRSVNDSQQNIWWQWRMDVEDVSFTDTKNYKFHITTPNFWLTNEYNRIPKCVPGQCVDKECQKCRGHCQRPEILSANKPAEQSSTYYEGGYLNASLALDGDSQTFSHTNSNVGDGKPWWRVDLGSRFNVQGVNIQTRHDSKGEQHTDIRTHYFEIRVGDFDPRTRQIPKNDIITGNNLCHYYDGNDLKAGKRYTFDCIHHDLVGRYVTIQIIKFCPTCAYDKKENMMILAEVEVYGCHWM